MPNDFPYQVESITNRVRKQTFIKAKPAITEVVTRLLLALCSNLCRFCLHQLFKGHGLFGLPLSSVLVQYSNNV